MRLIDADELVRKEIAFVGGPRSGGKTLAMIHSAIRHIVDNAPTVIAEPVRHGKWLKIVTYNGCTPDYDCVCSECGYSGLPTHKYCSECGAKMG